jgi:hypothetical protein
MSEVAKLQIAVGDKVRVHFHSPCPMRSFSEGVVRRVDVTTPEGSFFVMEVTHEVLLDREHRIRPGFLDYIRYECRNDFPGRIEILTAIAKKLDRESLHDPSLQGASEQDERPAAEPQTGLEPASGLIAKAETDSEPLEIQVERAPVRGHTSLMAAFFGRGR